MTYHKVEWLRGKYWDDPASPLKDRVGYLARMVGFNGLMREVSLCARRREVVGRVVPFTGEHKTTCSDKVRYGDEGLSSYSNEEVRVLRIGKESVSSISIVVPYVHQD